MTVTFVLPLKTRSPLNGAFGVSRGAAMAKAHERKAQRYSARLHLVAELRKLGLRPVDLVPCTVTLRRLSAGRLDTDNLLASQKSVRDGIADALGVDDGGSAVRWIYGQRPCKRGEYGTEVTIEPTKVRRALESRR